MDGCNDASCMRNKPLQRECKRNSVYPLEEKLKQQRIKLILEILNQLNQRNATIADEAKVRSQREILLNLRVKERLLELPVVEHLPHKNERLMSVDELQH